MEKVIYTDIDLTLLDFNEGLEKWLREVKGFDIEVGTLTGHSDITSAIDMSWDESTKLIHEFFDHDLFETLPALKGAPEAAQRLYADGWRFKAISACPVSAGPDRRLSNLENALGIEIDEVHLSGFLGCKKSILAEAIRETETPHIVWVEDNVAHAEVGHQLGFRTFLIDQLHNRDASGSFTRVQSWDEIADELCTGI